MSFSREDSGATVSTACPSARPVTVTIRCRRLPARQGERSEKAEAVDTFVADADFHADTDRSFSSRLYTGTGRSRSSDTASGGTSSPV